MRNESSTEEGPTETNSRLTELAGTHLETVIRKRDELVDHDNHPGDQDGRSNFGEVKLPDGKTLQFVIDPDMRCANLPNYDLQVDENHVRAMIAGNSNSCLFEKRYIHKNGQFIWVLMTASVARSLAGEPQYFIAQIQDVSARHQAEQDLKVSLAEKDVMLQEIHHRVKNNLQVITSMIQLQSYYVTDSSLLDALRDCQARVESMALVHERLYNSDFFARLDFGAHLKELTRLVSNARTEVQSSVQLLFRLEPVELSLEIALPLGLIANEILSNAYKHAFRGRSSGKLEVALWARGEDEIHLSISDDGPGLAKPFDVDGRAGSLGFRIIKTLARQIRAELNVSSSSVFKGVEFYVVVRLSEQSN